MSTINASHSRKARRATVARKAARKLKRAGVVK
jgi:hypothetical protein